MRRDGGLSHQAMKSLLLKQKEKGKNRSFTRENKNRPMEMSSKRPVPRLREVVEVTKKCGALFPPQLPMLPFRALQRGTACFVLHLAHIMMAQEPLLQSSQKVAYSSCSKFFKSHAGCCRETRDPRFDSLSGALQPDRFRKQYAFLYDEQLPDEREQLKATLQVCCSPLLGCSHCMLSDKASYYLSYCVHLTSHCFC